MDTQLLPPFPSENSEAGENIDTPKPASENTTSKPAEPKLMLRSKKVIYPFIISILILIVSAFCLRANICKALGDSYFEKNNYSKAADYYRSAINYNPKLYDAYCKLGQILNSEGKYDDAIQQFNKAINIKGNIADAYFLRGIAFLKKEEYEIAVNSFSTAISINNKKAE